MSLRPFPVAVAELGAASTLDTGFADPDLEAMRLKMNEMILNGRR